MPTRRSDRDSLAPERLGTLAAIAAGLSLSFYGNLAFGDPTFGLATGTVAGLGTYLAYLYLLRIYRRRQKPAYERDAERFGTDDPADVRVAESDGADGADGSPRVLGPRWRRVHVGALGLALVAGALAANVGRIRLGADPLLVGVGVLAVAVGYPLLSLVLPRFG